MQHDTVKMNQESQRQVKARMKLTPELAPSMDAAVAFGAVLDTIVEGPSSS